MNRSQLIALAAAAAALPALAAPAGANAALVPCYKALPGPGPAGWVTQQDGSQDITHQFKGGTNFDEGHGRLRVNGQLYPMVDGNSCFTTDTSIAYPWRVLGGMEVERKVQSIDGRIRRVDTIYNPNKVTALVQVEYAVEVKGSQVSIETESGDAAVTTGDTWSAHENDGDSFPFMQWGDLDGFHPAVVSEGDNPNVWQHKAGNMPDAKLVYTDLPVPPESSVQLLHVNGTAATAADAVARADNGPSAFSGMDHHGASQVVNWGDDPDGDGVGKVKDECPYQSGNSANGCLVFDVKPVGKPGDGTPPPADTPPAGDPSGPGGPGSPGSTDPAVDTTAPRIALSGLGRKVGRRALVRAGLAPRVDCDEACSLNVAVKRGKRTVRSARAAQRSAAARTIRLKLRPAQARRVAGRRITVVVTATDAAGNRRTLTRTVRVGR